MRKKTTIPDIVKMKSNGQRITVLTAYDFPFARLVDGGGIDIILVGDSAGVVLPATIQRCRLPWMRCCIMCGP